MVWWLSHCRYRSVLVGFLYVVFRLPSVCGITKMSRKKHGAICPGLFPSELYALVCGVDILQKAASVCFVDDYKSVIHISFPQTLGVG